MEPANNAAPAGAVAPPIPNFPLAVVGGLGAAIVGAALWTVVSVVTEMKLGIIAVAVGFVIGYAIRELGKGTDRKFGILGAACGLLGCALGDLMSAVAFYAKARDVPFLQVLTGLDPSFLIRLMSAFFSPMDLLFYAIAIYEAYKFSLRPVVR